MQWRALGSKVTSAAGRFGVSAVALLLFAFVLWARTRTVTQDLWLQGDQIRDWSVALGSFWDLPLSGPPSVAGGRALGPVYYWLLWGVRVTVGPFFDNLPHAGAIGLAIFHSAADVCFFFGVRRFAGSVTTALAAALLVAIAPYDLALSSTVWSPPVAVSFVKVSLALAVFSATHPSRWRMAATVAIAWLAVQTHSSAIMVFPGIAAWFVIRELRTRQWMAAVQTVRVILEIVLLLQVPNIVDRLRAPEPESPTMIVEGVRRLVDAPGSADVPESYRRTADLMAYLWAPPFPAWLGVTLALALAGMLVSARRRPWVALFAAAPWVIAVLGFSAWPFPFETYWLLVLSPPLALMVAAAVSPPSPRRAALVMGSALLVVIVWTLPARLVKASTIHRMPEYETLVRGTRQIIERTRVVTGVVAEFPLHPSTDPAFAFVCMGGTISPDASHEAVITAAGNVGYRVADRD